MLALRTHVYTIFSKVVSRPHKLFTWFLRIDMSSRSALVSVCVQSCYLKGRRKNKQTNKKTLKTGEKATFLQPVEMFSISAHVAIEEFCTGVLLSFFFFLSILFFLKFSDLG